MRLTERLLDSEQFQRRKATEDTKRKITSWDIWECSDPTFHHNYDKTVTMFVHEGDAILTFENGETVDLTSGDLLTVYKGAVINWIISNPIRNSYCYHDSFHSAAERDAHIHWQKS